MANGASRIFRILKNTQTSSEGSKYLTVTAKSINPLIFSIDDRLTINSNFYTLAVDIDIAKIKVGDKFTAFTFNNGQLYYINYPENTSQDVMKPNSNLQNLIERLDKLEKRIEQLENKEVK